MGIYYKTGDLLDAPVEYICHQVNCQGCMGSGIAKQIKNRWPEVYEAYTEWYQSQGSQWIMSNILIVPVDGGKNIVNMASQYNYGYDGRRYTSYDAFWTCLGHIRETVPKGSKIGFPERIGCGLGGANWDVIRTMIEQVLAEDYEVYIYILGGAE